MQIRPYDPAVDVPGLYDLWQTALGGGISTPVKSSHWPVTRAWFQQVIDEPGYHPEHLVAEVGGQVVGFVLARATQTTSPRAALLAQAVHPRYQRQGIGRRLHDAVLVRLRARGVRRVQLGAGAGGYFWPGVPADLPDAWPFFRALGWPEVERSYDLVRPLSDYQTPAWVWTRVGGLDVDFVTADEGSLESKVIDFVTLEQPGWKASYERAFAEKRAQDVLLAVQRVSGQILGAALVESPAQRWVLRLQPPVGAPACILTADAAQGQGIGMALAARASEILRARGCQSGFLGWIWLVDWYAKLGYTVWQEYIMSWQEG